MIYLYLCGGLGNQLFQYAYAKKIQKKSNDNVTLLTKSYLFHDAIRKPSIKKFNIDESWAEDSDYLYLDDHRLLYFYDRGFYVLDALLCKLKLNKLAQKCYMARHKRLFKHGIYMEHYFGCSVDPEVYTTKNKYIEGMWHFPVYFDDMRDELIKEFVLKDTSEVPRDLADEVEKKDTVCVHIRRGDYLQYSCYQVCDAAYYIRAIEKMRTMHPGCRFIVFSDDIAWCRENISSSDDVMYVDKSNPDYVDFDLMRRCSHFIISNSTFSWWAAYLGQAENKTVMTPDKWYNNGINKPQLNLPSWTVMETGV